MFGYVRPLECELRVREQAAYRAVYCGLCKTIGARYGTIGRLTLQYDCAFLAAFLLEVSGGAQFYRGGCVPRLYRRRRPIAKSCIALDYAADVNILLSYYAVCDNVRDEGRLGSAAARLALRRAYQSAAKRQPELNRALDEALKRLNSIERAEVVGTDAASDASGHLLEALAAHAPNLKSENRTAAKWLFYNIGKWICLLDAWEDRERDAKSHSYNPFLTESLSPDDAAFLMNVARAEAEKALDLITFAGGSAITQNVVRLGLDHAAKRVLTDKSACTQKGVNP